MRRVVITGVGLVTPLGVGVDHVWSNILSGKSGAKHVTDFDVSDIPCQIGCFLPRGSGPGEFNPDEFMEPKEQRKVDEFIVYAMGAADQAIADSGWKARNEDERARAGVLIGSGIGGLQGIEKGAMTVREKGPRRLSPFFIPGRLINLAGGYVSIKHGLKGPNYCRGDGLLDGRTRHRGRCAPDCPRRCRCDGCRWHREPTLPPCLGGVRRLQSAIDAFQRRPDARVAAL